MITFSCMFLGGKLNRDEWRMIAGTASQGTCRLEASITSKGMVSEIEGEVV